MPTSRNALYGVKANYAVRRARSRDHADGAASSFTIRIASLLCKPLISHMRRDFRHHVKTIEVSKLREAMEDTIPLPSL